MPKIEHFLVLIWVLLGVTAVDGLFEGNGNGSADKGSGLLSPMAACLKRCSKGCSETEQRKDLGAACFFGCHDTCKSQSPPPQGLSESVLKFAAENHCLNGKDPSTLTLKQNLLEFAKGKCSPVLLVPDFMGSKLVIQIACEALRLGNPSLFRTCGWNACKNPDSDFTLHVPEPEYTIWIPDRLSPMSVFSQYEHTGLCFAGLLKTKVNYELPPEKIVQFQPGVSVQVFGATAGSRTQDACRSNSAKDIWVDTDQKSAAKGLGPIIQALEAQGYVSGLTYQVLPYNPFRTIQQNEVRSGLFMTLARFHLHTRKRTTLVGHGFGNSHLLYNLMFLSPTFKKAFILNWVAVAPGFFGSSNFSKLMLVNGNPVGVYATGGRLRFDHLANLNSGLITAFEQLPVDPFQFFAGEAWLKKVGKRILYEKDPQNIPFSESGIPFWPSANELCASKGPQKQPGKCLTGLYRTDQEDILGIGDQNWKLEGLKKLLIEKCLVKQTRSFWKGVWERDYLRTDPEVPVVVIFGANIRQMKYEWYSPSNFASIQNGKWGKADLVKGGAGDGMFETFSSLMLPLRWALSDRGESKRPVVFLEYCSTNSPLKEIYDKKSDTEEYQISETRYHGIGCQCTKNDDTGCGHFDVLDDERAIGAIQKTLVANQRVSEEELKRIEPLSERVLQDELKFCSFLYPEDSTDSDSPIEAEA